MHEKLDLLFGGVHDVSYLFFNITSSPMCNAAKNNIDSPIIIDNSDDDEEVNSPVDMGRKPPRNGKQIVGTQLIRGKISARNLFPMKPTSQKREQIDMEIKYSPSCCSSTNPLKLSSPSTSPLKLPSPSGKN